MLYNIDIEQMKSIKVGDLSDETLVKYMHELCDEYTRVTNALREICLEASSHYMAHAIAQNALGYNPREVEKKNDETKTS